MNTENFEIHLTGDVTQKSWVGQFTAKKRLTHRDYILKDQKRRELLGAWGGESDETALSIAVAVSELYVRLTKFPEWFKEVGFGLDLEDNNILREIYRLAMGVETRDAEERQKETEAKTKEIKESIKE